MVRAADASRRRRALRRLAFLERLEPRCLLAGAVSGTVFADLDEDGSYEPAAGETPVSGAIVYIDVDNNRELSRVPVSVEPDNYVEGAILNNRVPGFTLSATTNTNKPSFDVTAENHARASTGGRVFAHAGVAFWNDGRRLRVDYDAPGRDVAVDFIANSNGDVGTLQVFNDQDQLLANTSTPALAAGDVRTMTLSRHQGDIAYAVAWASTGAFGRLDNLRLNHLGPTVEPSTTTDADGRYQLTDIPEGTWTVRMVVPPGQRQTVPTTNRLPSTFIYVPNRSDHVFDARRGIVYIATRDGTVERFDVGTQSLLQPLFVGGKLSSIDLAPDGDALFVGEQNTGPEIGFVRKISLLDESKENLSYSLTDANHSGVNDLAVAGNGKALFSIRYNGSNTVPLWQVDLASGAASTVLPAIEQFSTVSRSADRSLLLIHGTNSTSNTIRVYDSATGAIIASKVIDNVTGAFSAISPNGKHIAFRSFGDGFSILDRDLRTVEILPHFKGGAVFDPVRELLYAVDTATDELVALRTDTYAESFRLPIGEDMKDFSPLDPTALSVSPDGRFLLLSTPAGVRLFELAAAEGHSFVVTTDEQFDNRNFGRVADPHTLPTPASIAGRKWDDANGNGVIDAGEPGLEGFRIYLDLNQNGAWDQTTSGVGVGQVIEPDDFSEQFVLNRHFPGVVLSAAGTENKPSFKVTVNKDQLAPTGRFVFGHANIGFWNNTRRLRMDFVSPMRYVAIDFAGSSIFNQEFGRLDVFNRNNELLETYETLGLLAGQVERMSITRPADEIAYAVAYIADGKGNFGRLDNLRFAATATMDEPSQLTDADGRYAFDRLTPGVQRVGEVPQPGWQQTFPLAASDPGHLIDVPKRVDHAYDATRDLLFVSTSDGKLARYDLSENTLLSDFTVGSSLSGLDLSPDAEFAYVGEVNTGADVGFIRKVDLDTGTRTNIQFPVTGNQGGVKDLAIGNRGKALFSILFNGSSGVPLFDLTLDTNDAAERLASVEQHTLIARSADRSLLFLHGSNSHPAEIRTYDPATDTFSLTKTVGNVVGANSAVNANGSVIALRSTNAGVALLNADLETVEIVHDLRGGLAFDPVRNRMFGIDSERNELLIYEVLGNEKVYRIPIREDIKVFSTLDRTALSTTPDGSHLFISTPAGVQVFQIDTPGQHQLSLGFGDAVTDVNFGNRATGENRSPRAEDDRYETDEDKTLIVAASGVLANDKDPDGDVLSAVLVDDVSRGSLTLNSNGSFTYVPGADFIGQDRFSYRAKDADLESSTAVVTIDVKGLNDAPIVRPAAPSLAGNEDQVSTVQTTAFVNAGPGTTQITDADPGDPLGGLALIGAAGRGSWLYSLNGADFLALGTVGETQSLLLPPGAHLRYLPDGENGEEARVSYRGWDQTSGAAGDRVDTTSNGGTTAYSSLTDTLTLDVADVNDRPLLTPADPQLTTDEDTPLVISVASLSGDAANQTRITDVDAGDPIGGLAILDASGRGAFSYSLDGNEFFPIAAVSESSALLLPRTASLRYEPPGDQGETATLQYRAWDQSRGQAGGRGDTTVAGPTVPYSEARDTLTIDVSDVNDAPALTPAGPSDQFSEDEVLVAALSLYINQGPETTAISDPDPLDVVGGIALIAFQGRGLLEYSLGGGDFDKVGSVSDAEALLLPEDATIRYTPDGKTGELMTFDFRAWDQTAGTAGERFDASSFGGTTAFSSLMDRLNVQVTDVNDAPVLEPFAAHRTTDEDTPIRLQLTQFINAGPETTIIGDVDATDPVGGIGMIGKSGGGTWHYSLDGAAFSEIPAVTASNALLLPHDAWIEYRPDGRNGETAGISFVAWDRSQGDPGGSADTAERGGTAPFSELSDELRLEVQAVNDAPVLTARGPLRMTSEDAPLDAALATIINDGGQTTEVGDVDLGTIVGAIAVIETQGNGQWQYTENGSDYLAVGAVDENSALLLSETAALRYLPDEKNGETAIVRYVAWDQSAGQPGDRPDVTARGGTTPFSQQADTLTVEVADRNDAPMLTAAAYSASTDEDTVLTLPSSSWVNQPGGPQIIDVDAGAVVGGLAVEMSAGEGTWEYSLDGAQFVPLGTVSPAAARLLSHDGALRYRPNQISGETATLQFRAWDGTVGQAGALADARATGGETAFSSAMDALTINVADVNDRPTAIMLDNATVDENSAGQVVGQLSASDPDPHDRHTFKVSDGRFEVNAQGQLKLKPDEALDHESTPTITLAITATDDGTPPLQLQRSFQITVLDLNDPPTVDQPQSDQTAQAGVPFEYTVGQATFADQDVGDELTLSAALAGGAALPQWLNFAAETGRFTGTPTDDDVGAVTVRVTATDRRNASVADDFELDVEENPFPWNNPRNRLDVDDNGFVEPLDALININYVNSQPGDPNLPPLPFRPPPYYDTSGDNFITPIDILLIINFLNLRDAEGETGEVLLPLVAPRDVEQPPTDSSAAFAEFGLPPTAGAGWQSGPLCGAREEIARGPRDWLDDLAEDVAATLLEVIAEEEQ